MTFNWWFKVIGSHAHGSTDNNHISSKFPLNVR